MKTWDSARVVGWASEPRTCDKGAILYGIESSQISSGLRVVFGRLGASGGIPTLGDAVDLYDKALAGSINVSGAYAEEGGALQWVSLSRKVVGSDGVGQEGQVYYLTPGCGPTMIQSVPAVYFENARDFFERRKVDAAALCEQIRDDAYDEAESTLAGDADAIAAAKAAADAEMDQCLANVDQALLSQPYEFPTGTATTSGYTDCNFAEREPGYAEQAYRITGHGINVEFEITFHGLGRDDIAPCGQITSVETTALVNYAILAICEDPGIEIIGPPLPPPPGPDPDPEPDP